MPPVNIIDPATGKTHGVSEEEATRLVGDGWKLEDADSHLTRLTDERREEEYGGVLGGVAAGGAALLRGGTAGLSDVVFSGLGEAEDIRNLRDTHQGLSVAGEIGGALLTAKLPVPAGAVSRLGSNIAKAGEGAGALTRIGRASAGAAAEGGLFGAGTAVSEIALAKDPLSLEQMASTLGSRTIFGAALGGGIGLGTKAAAIGLGKAKGALDDIARGADEAAAPPMSLDDVAAYQKTVKDANPWLVIDDSASARLLTTNKQIRKAMDDPAVLAKTPQAMLKPLRIQAKALQETLDAADDITLKLGETSKKMAGEITEQIGKLADDAEGVVLSGRTGRRYAAFADVKVPKAGVTVSREQAAKFASALDNGEVLGSGQASLGKIQGLLDANQALQAKIEAGIAGAAGKPGAAQTMAGNMLGGSAFGIGASAASAVPVIGPMLAPFVGAAASKLVTEGLGKAAAKTAARASKAIGTFLDVGAKAPNIAPVLATKVLGAVRYAPGPKAKKGSTVTLAEGHKARTDEIKSQTMYGPNGRAVMRPEARARMAASLAPIAAIDPLAADRIETIQARKIEFLANRLPRRPDLGGMSTGPDRWQPSDLAMRATARYMAAVEDPIGIVERLATGQITPEDAEVMREVFPEMYADIQRQILEQLPTLQKTLPYQRRLALSIFSGIPVDPAMNPRILSVLQASFTNEPGTEGGSQAPQASPAFGSVKNQEATPSQTRAGVST